MINLLSDLILNMNFLTEQNTIIHLSRKIINLKNIKMLLIYIKENEIIKVMHVIVFILMFEIIKIKKFK